MTAVWQPSGFLEINGRRLEYACFGPPPDLAPTIVLLHEGLGCVALWRSFPQQLVQATGCGVLAYSRAGYGQSDPVPLPRPITYMTEEAQVTLGRVLDAVGIRKAILVGHSDGATIAAIYAGTVPDQRVAAAVLIAPHFFSEPMGLAEIAKAKVAYETTDLGAKMAKYHRDPHVAFLGWNGAWLSPQFEDWNVEGVLDTIHVPILAIQGADDQYGTLAQIDVISARCPTMVRRCILPNTHHAPHLESPEQTLGEIADFCRDLQKDAK